MTTAPEPSPFGLLLRDWRRVRGVSQLELAGIASSTSRHISFLENGRSRPGRDLVLRIAGALGLPFRESNDLLVAAGLAPQYSDHGLGTDQLSPYRAAIDALLVSHEPYPACVIDRWGQIVLTNEAFDVMNPGVKEMTPEQLLEMTFGPENGRLGVANWEELAWAFVDRMSAPLRRSADPRLEQMVTTVMGYLGDTPRPDSIDEAHIRVHLDLDGVQLSTFTTFVRFENARDVTLSELAVELIFPADEATRESFERLTASRSGVQISPRVD